MFDFNFGQSDLDADGEGGRCDADDDYVSITAVDVDRFEWEADQGVLDWNAYRGALDVLRAGGAHAQAPGSNLDAARWCALGGGVGFYLVSAIDAAGERPFDEGYGTNRSNAAPCP